MNYIELARKERGINQRLYLIETIITNNEYQKQYVVMGSTCNIYTVSIDKSPECTCPDYKQRHKRCKHIYFVLARVMKLDDKLVDQLRYTNTELLNMFDNIPQVTENLIVDSSKKQKYESLKNKPKDSPCEKKSIDDVCPICLDDLDNGLDIDHCKYSCGKSVHVECFAMWTKQKGPFCVYCTKNFNEKPIETEYVNLA
jgi:hypothetical protein